MVPMHEIGHHVSISTLSVGDVIVCQRGSAAYFFGSVDFITHDLNGHVKKVRIRVRRYFHQQFEILPPKRPLFKDVEQSPKTSFMTWLMPGVNTASGKSAPTASSFKSADEASAAAQARRQARKAYVGARIMLQQGRDQLSETLQLLGLDSGVTLEEFKKVRREVMIKWHPDRERMFITNGGMVSTFKAESEKFITALAFIENFIVKRDGLNKS